MDENGNKTTYSIRQINKSRGNKMWYGIIREAGCKPKQISLHTENEKAAKEWLTRMQAEALLPPLMKKATRDVPLQDAIDDYSSYLKSAVKHITVVTYSYRLRPCWTYFKDLGIKSLREITQGVLLRMAETFPNDRRKTLRERYKSVKAWLVWCRDNYELADFQPWHNVKLKALPPEQEKEYWTVDQLDRLLAACPTDIYRLFLGFMVYAGLRFRESLEMTWESIREDLSDFTLIGKMDKQCTLPIAEKLKALILKVRGDGNPTGRIFPPEVLPQTSWELIALLKAVVMAAGLKNPGKIGHHKIRHSFATNLLRGPEGKGGFDIKTVSRALRHEKVSTTLDIYCHTSDDSVREAINQL